MPPKTSEFILDEYCYEMEEYNAIIEGVALLDKDCKYFGVLNEAGQANFYDLWEYKDPRGIYIFLKMGETDDDIKYHILEQLTYANIDPTIKRYINENIIEECNIIDIKRNLKTGKVTI